MTKAKQAKVPEPERPVGWGWGRNKVQDLGVKVGLLLGEWKWYRYSSTYKCFVHNSNNMTPGVYQPAEEHNRGYVNGAFHYPCGPAYPPTGAFMKSVLARHGLRITSTRETFKEAQEIESGGRVSVHGISTGYRAYVLRQKGNARFLGEGHTLAEAVLRAIYAALEAPLPPGEEGEL